MRSFGERIDILMEKLNNNCYNNTERTPFYNNDVLLELPLKNDIDLLDFEQKLLDSSFKMKIVSFNCYTNFLFNIWIQLKI